MGLDYIIGILIALVLTPFFVYLAGRLFGLGFSVSIKQGNTKETKRGTRQ